MSDETKLCIDCRHCMTETHLKLSLFKLVDYYTVHKCKHPDYVSIDYVEGKNEFEDCDTMRFMECGPEGKGWEVNAPDL